MGKRTIDQASKFRKELKKLSKKHPGLDLDVTEILNGLSNDTIPEGDQVPGFEGLQVFKKKVRMGNMGARRGARIIYYKDDSRFLALSIYAKNEKDDITDKDIKDILKILNEIDLG